jgi:hypothetical protein
MTAEIALAFRLPDQHLAESRITIPAVYRSSGKSYDALIIMNIFKYIVIKSIPLSTLPLLIRGPALNY